jgi:diacylglycerol kinase family enzyme
MAYLDDGLIEVWLFQGSGLLTLAQHALFIALEQHHGADGVQYLRGHSFSVETFPPSPYQLDGEPAGVTPLACHVERLALRVLDPKHRNGPPSVQPAWRAAILKSACERGMDGESIGAN